MTTRNVAIALAISTVLVAGTACDDEVTAQFGDLQITYRIGSGTSTCEEVGIAFVRVYLDVSETETALDEIASCTPDDQSVVLQDVPVGTYDIRVEGMDSDNGVIYSGATEENVEVVADQTNGPVNVVLTQLRPAIMIWFDFAEAGNCSRFEVADIEVVLYENGSSQIYSETFPCETRISESLLIENLSETSTYDLRVRGTNDNDEYTYEYNQDAITVAPGAPTEIGAELEACSGLCSAP